jgi:aminoglycoside 6-adenylyltransferase
VKLGANGRGLRRHVRPDLWAALERTYVGAETAANWDALFQTIDLFRTVAIEVGEQLGYAYPHELEQRISAAIERVRRLDRPAEQPDEQA